MNTATVTKAATKAATAAARAASARTMSMPLDRAEHSCFPVTVTAVVELTPVTRRLTLHTTQLAGYQPLGPDEFFGLVMPPRGAPLPPLPTDGSPSPRGSFDHLPGSLRPEVRWYTVRAHRPALGELDVDVVTHGDEGPGTAWVRRARPGSAAGFQTGTACYRTEGVHGTHLVVGDETAVPAISGILGQLPPGVRARVVVEVPEDGVVPPPPAVPDAEVRVVHRGTGTPGSALLPAVQQLDLEGLTFAWVCGEQTAVAAVRRHVVRERGLDRRAVYFCGYWSRGRPRG